MLPGGDQFRDHFRVCLQLIAQVAAVRQGKLPAGVECVVHDCSIGGFAEKDRMPVLAEFLIVVTYYPFWQNGLISD